MRKTAWIVVVLTLAGSPVLAAPDNGFGLAWGLAGHHVAWELNDGSFYRYDSIGLSLAGDAQFVVDDRWSLNPFLLLTLERAHGDQEATVSNGAGGFQVRHWWDTLYLGAHVGYYVELLMKDNFNSTRYGPGLGAAIGEEPRDALGWGVQMDLPRVAVYGETRVGLRLHLAYRWR